MSITMDRNAMEEWIWTRDGLVPELKLFMLALLKTGDPQAADEIAGLQPGQAGLYQDMLVAAGWAKNGGSGLTLALPLEANGAAPAHGTRD
jgi:hypothetical protein